MSLSSSSWDSSYWQSHGLNPPWRPLFHSQLHAPQMTCSRTCIPGHWCLSTCVISGKFQELLDRLLLEWRAARQVGETVFLAWRARKTLCTPCRKECGYLCDANKDLDVIVIFSLFALGRKGVADFPPLAYARNRKWTDSPFLRSLCLTTALFVRRSQDENRVLDLVFARRRTDWQLDGRSWAVLWMIDVFKKLQKKKRNYRIRKGGGDGAGARVRVCQVNVTRIMREVFKILNFVFGNLSFVFRSPYSTVCSHMEQIAQNWGRQTGPLVEKLVAKLTTAACDLVAKNIFWSQMATRRLDYSSPVHDVEFSLTWPTTKIWSAHCFTFPHVTHRRQAVA